MKTLGPGMGPGSKMELSQNLDRMRFKPNDSSKASGKLEFADLVQDRSPKPKEDMGRDMSQTRERQNDRPNELRPDDRQNDSQPGKLEDKGKASKAEKPQSSKTDVRKQAMLEFMDSMENEFGITPARMLEAMANIDTETLSLTPEETASQVMENLELTPEEKPLAMALYSGFINQWKELQDVNPQAQPVAHEDSKVLIATGTAGVLGTGALGEAMKQEPTTSAMKSQSGQVKLGEGWQNLKQPESLEPQMMSAQERRAKLNESLDQLNARFFVNPEKALPQAPDLESQLLAQRAQEGIKLQSEMPQMPPEVANNFFQDESGLYSAKSPLMDKTAVLPGLTPELTPGLSEVAGPKVSAMGGLESALAALTAEANSLKAAAEAAGGESSDSFGESTDADLGELRSEDLSGLGPKPGDFGQVFKPQAPIGSAAAAAATPLMVADEKAAIEALQQQAQIMVDKGGGEAKISFNQEGLGNVSLKIVVHEGKVNLEMNTDSQEAKRLLESSISDLKSSLAQHKIAVDQVRVDVGSSALSDQKQPAMNFGQDMNRDQARQMMQQFRDETAGRRDPFYEMSGIKAYARKMNGPEPIPAAPDVALKRYAGQGRGDRMNLVA